MDRFERIDLAEKEIRESQRVMWGQEGESVAEQIRGFSLLQPWASGMEVGAKTVETRDWSTKYRGWLAIAASARFVPADREMLESRMFREALEPHGYKAWQDFPLGHIIAVVHLDDVIPTERFRVSEHTRIVVRDGNEVIISPQEHAFGNYDPKRYGWLTSHLKRLPRPVKCTGQLGLWQIPADVLEQVREGFRAA